MRRQVFLQRVATILLLIGLGWLNGCYGHNSGHRFGQSPINSVQVGAAQVSSADMIAADAPKQPISGKVAVVPSGDRLIVQSATQKLELRLCGIDAPELTQPLGKAAQAELEKLVGGKDVQFLPIRQQAQHLIAEVFLPQPSGSTATSRPPPLSQLWSKLFNQSASNPSDPPDSPISRTMVEAGFACVYAPYIEECPHRQTVLQAETTAQEAQRGLWQQGLIKPWDYRRQQIVQALTGIEPISSAQAKALKKFRPDYLRNGMQQTMLAIASWYGPVLQGKQTANGETFNQDALTAAHRSLPFNTRLKVTNLRNGKSVIVRINDRQPALTDLVIDLSKAAARQIGSLDTGIVPVELEILQDQV
jgi:rare lipoprotein A (peptidoglycan hydrolase)